MARGNERGARLLKALLVLLLLVPVASAQWTDGASNPYGETPIRVHLETGNLTAETARYEDEARAALRYWEQGGNGAMRWEVRFEFVERPEDAMMRVVLVDGPGVPCNGRLAAGCGGFFEGDNGTVRGFAASALQAGAPGAPPGQGPSPSARYLPYETVREVVAHEVGHALGLRHSDVVNDIMYRHVTANGFADAPGDTWLQRNPAALLVLVLAIGTSPFLGWRVWRAGSRWSAAWRERRAMAAARRREPLRPLERPPPF